MGLLVVAVAALLLFHGLGRLRIPISDDGISGLSVPEVRPRKPDSAVAFLKPIARILSSAYRSST
jgi:hypothetical protein